MPATPDSINISFRGHHTQFNGLRMEVLRKNDSVLLQFDFMLMGPDPTEADLYEEAIEQRKANGLVEKLMKQQAIKLIPAADVPDAQYFAPDISDYERKTSIFIEVPPNGTLVQTMIDTVEALKKFGGQIERVNNGPSFP